MRDDISRGIHAKNETSDVQNTSLIQEQGSVCRVECIQIARIQRGIGQGREIMASARREIGRVRMEQRGLVHGRIRGLEMALKLGSIVSKQKHAINARIEQRGEIRGIRRVVIKG